MEAAGTDGSTRQLRDEGRMVLVLGVKRAGCKDPFSSSIPGCRTLQFEIVGSDPLVEIETAVSSWG
jgi:hypothetical protein